jgi:hypothetical protein
MIRRAQNNNSIPSAVGSILGGAMANAQSAMMQKNGAVGEAMNQATAQIASAVAQEMVAAVTAAAMPYTGGQSNFGQGYAVPSSGKNYNERVASIESGMRAAILGSQLPTHKLFG